MLVVSMADFNASPSKYTKKTFSIEEDGHKWIVRPVREPISKTFNLNVLTSFLVLLGLKKRPLGFLKGKASFRIIDDSEIIPEEIFDDINDLNGSIKNFSKTAE